MAVKNPGKLTLADKKKIYRLYKDQHLTKQQLATKFNCTLSVVKTLISNLDSPLHDLRLRSKRSGIQEPDMLPREQWRKITYPSRTMYEVSNMGRVRSYFLDARKPVISKGVLQLGYIFLDYFNTQQERRIKVPFHVIVADHFLTKASPAHERVIHLDYTRANNKSSNLKWVTQEQFKAHLRKNPAAKIARTVLNASRTKGAKLTLKQVDAIRKLLADPARKLTKEAIAAKYDIAPMTLYRIQSGEIWGDKGTPLLYEKKQVPRMSEKTIKAIKKKLEKKDVVQSALAKEYGVSPTIINRIKRGVTYKAV